MSSLSKIFPLYLDYHCVIGKIHGPAKNKCLTLSLKVVSSEPRNCEE